MKILENLELAEKERDSVVAVSEVLKSELPVARVILFGSKARGAGSADSDVDLLVLTSCPVSSELRGAVSERLADINLENSVSLASVVVSEQDWSSGLIRHTLIHSEIEREGCEICQVGAD